MLDLPVFEELDVPKAIPGSCFLDLECHPSLSLNTHTKDRTMGGKAQRTQG